MRRRRRGKDCRRGGSGLVGVRDARETVFALTYSHGNDLASALQILHRRHSVPQRLNEFDPDTLYFTSHYEHAASG